VTEWHHSFKPKGQSHGKGSGGVVPMVVNPLGWINHTLTEEEKTTMMKEGRCFRCGNKGHMSKACPTQPTPSSTPNTPKNKTQHARATKVEEVDEESDEEPEMKLGVDQVINSIHAMTEEEREDFLTKAFAQKDF
jgi:Zinc knuckle